MKGNSKVNGDRFDPSVVVVPLSELVVECEVAEVAGYWIRKLGVELIEDWRGERALRVGDARRVRDARLADKAEHDARWAAYQQFLVDRRDEKRRQHELEIAKEIERKKNARTVKAQALAERALREREQAFAAAAAADAERRPSFDTWKAANP